MNELDRLSQIAIHHGTDKYGAHFYTPVYHQLLAGLRDRPLRLLELGVGGYGWKTVGGASLAMWAEYFPQAQVVGIDIEEKRLELGPRVTVRRGSQADAQFLGRLCDELGPFDLILDDGSHRPEHVVASFDALFPRLADGGLYLIEDTQTAWWPQFGGTPEGGATMELVVRLLQELQHAERAVANPTLEVPARARSLRSIRAMHNLVVVEKGDNTEPSNFRFDPENPHVQRSLAHLQAEYERAPSPGAAASLVVMFALGRDQARADRLVRDALKRWPRDSTLQMLAIDVFTAPAERLEALNALATLDGPSAALDRVHRAVLAGELAMFAAASP